MLEKNKNKRQNLQTTLKTQISCNVLANHKSFSFKVDLKNF